MLGKYKENPVPQQNMANIPIENNPKGRLGILPDDKLVSRGEVSDVVDDQMARDRLVRAVLDQFGKEYDNSLKTDDPESYREKLKKWMDDMIDQILPDIIKENNDG